SRWALLPQAHGFEGLLRVAVDLEGGELALAHRPEVAQRDLHLDPGLLAANGDLPKHEDLLTEVDETLRAHPGVREHLPRLPEPLSEALVATERADARPAGREAKLDRLVD